MLRKHDKNKGHFETTQTLQTLTKENGVTVLISHSIDFKAGSVTEDKGPI